MTTPESSAAALCVIGMFLSLMRVSIHSGKRNRLGRRKNYWCESGMSKTIGNREIQEDSFGMLESEEGVMAVLADGMGKQFGGKIASQAAVEVFKDIFADRNAFYNPQYYFRRAFQGANREILNLLDAGQGKASVAAVLIRNNQLYYADVGNVKIAVYRNHELVPITAGHTINVLAKKQYSEGKLSRQNAVALLERHRLYNYVGQDGFHDVEFFDTPIHLRGGEYVLLMTDGLYEEARWKDIEDCLEEEGTCQEKAYALVELVNRSKAEDKDNASVVILKVKGRT